MHNQTQNSPSLPSRNLSRAIPEPPPSPVQRGGDKTGRTLLHSGGDEAPPSAVVRGGDTEEAPPSGVVRG